MNRFTRSTIALAALTLAGVFSFSSQASADTATITVGATVPPNCAFTAATNIAGTLGQNLATKTLDSTNGNGFGSIDLDCNSAGSQLAITSVNFVQPTGASTNLASQLVTVTHLDGTITNNGTTTGAPITITSTGVRQVKVDAKAIYNAPLIAGTYTFTVVLTANP